MTEFKPGDRVRVTLEGTLSSSGVRDDGVYYSAPESGPWYVPSDAVTSIEKIEPPVEVFKAGDVVRHRDSKSVRALTTDGYTFLSGPKAGRHVRYENAIYRPHDFTSDEFERVTLS